VLGGLITTIVGLIGWHWPDHIETTDRELDFEREHDILVFPNGSPTVSRWSMGIIVLLVATCTLLFVFSYFYITLAHVEWPMGNLPHPGLLLPAIGTVGVLVAAVGMYWANRRIARGDVVGMRIGLALAFIAGAVAAGVLVWDLRQVPFSHSLNAYGSLYWTLTIFLIAILLGGLLQNLFTQVWSWFGRYSQREHVAVDIGGLYWYAMIVFWLLLAGTVYLAPYLL
jgi:heme/copper-type cytochrome/quinol oxidase subunit 3